HGIPPAAAAHTPDGGHSRERSSLPGTGGPLVRLMGPSVLGLSLDAQAACAPGPCLESPGSAMAQTLASTGSFYRARIASLLAIAPLGIWTVIHLWDNLSAFSGAREWEQAVTGARHPFHQTLLVVLVLLPLLLHTVWGIV